MPVIDQMTFQDLPTCTGCGMYRELEPGDKKDVIVGRVDPEWRPLKKCVLCTGGRVGRVKPRKRKRGGPPGGKL